MKGAVIVLLKLCVLVFALLLGNVWTGEPRLCYLASVAGLPEMQIADIL